MVISDVSSLEICMDLNLFLGESMVPLDYKNEVRQIKSENLNFLRHLTATYMTRLVTK